MVSTIRHVPFVSLDELVDALHKQWGCNIGETLSGQGRSVRWLAREVDVRPSSVSRWITGESEIRDRYKFAVSRALSVPVRVLFPYANGDAV